MLFLKKKYDSVVYLYLHPALLTNDKAQLTVVCSDVSLRLCSFLTSVCVSVQVKETRDEKKGVLEDQLKLIESERGKVQSQCDGLQYQVSPGGAEPV